MALNFPSSPSDGQIHVENNITYRYNSTVGAWLIVPASIPGVEGVLDKQILFNNSGSSNGSNGMIFDLASNTTLLNNVFVSSSVTTNRVSFNTAASITATEAQLTWNADESTLDIGLANGFILQTGQETLYRVKNQTGSSIAEGTVVMAAGTLGASGRILVAPFKANGQFESKYCMGVTTSTIANGGDGYVTHFGKVRGIDTSMWSEGDILYANASVAGGFSNTMPSAPNNKITIAFVVSKHAETGTLFVRPTYGSRINEDELAEISGLTDGDVLVYNSTAGRFENEVQLSLNAGSVDGLTANTIIESANGYARVFANSVGTAANANLSIATIASNSYATSVGTAGNVYSDSVGTSANNHAGVMANSSNAYASATYFAKSGGTISGDVVITGNATISGETTFANTQTLLIGDSIFVLNADLPVAVAPSEDAGMEVNRGSSSNVSLVWSESLDKWSFTNDGSTYVTIASNTDITTVGTSANAYASSVGLSSNNFAGVMANSSNAYAASLTPDLSPVFLVANAAFDKANAANVLACTAFDAANTKVSSVTGTAGEIFSSGGTTPTLNLITTAVSSGIYGGATQIPVINIDAYGRITSASNASVQGMDYAFANSVGTSANAWAVSVFANSASPTFTGTVTMNANVASQTLTDAATIAWDTSLGQIATVTLTSTGRTMDAPTNLKVGTYILHVVQDAGGSKTITTWNSVFKWPGGVAPVLTTTANARDLFSFVCDGTNLYGSFLPDVK